MHGIRNQDRKADGYEQARQAASGVVHLPKDILTRCSTFLVGLGLEAVTRCIAGEMSII